MVMPNMSVYTTDWWANVDTLVKYLRLTTLKFAKLYINYISYA